MYTDLFPFSYQIFFPSPAQPSNSALYFRVVDLAFVTRLHHGTPLPSDGEGGGLLLGMQPGLVLVRYCKCVEVGPEGTGFWLGTSIFPQVSLVASSSGIFVGRIQGCDAEPEACLTPAFCCGQQDC